MMSHDRKSQYRGSAVTVRWKESKPTTSPGKVFTAAYMQFFNYFLVEKLFGGNRHLGLSDDQALNSLTKIFAYGTLSEKKMASFKKKASRAVN